MATARHQRAVTGEKPHCPQCEGIELRRQGRVGLMQRVVLPRLGLFPWECGLCRKIYFLRQRSTGYRQHSTAAAVTRLDLVPAVSAARPMLKALAQKKSAS